jgi:hypothetical protein
MRCRVRGFTLMDSFSFRVEARERKEPREVVLVSMLVEGEERSEGQSEVELSRVERVCE